MRRVLHYKAWDGLIRKPQEKEREPPGQGNLLPVSRDGGVLSSRKIMINAK